MSFQTLKLQLNSSTLKQGVLKSMCWLIHVENKSLRLSQKLTFPLLLMRALDFRQISASFSCLLLLWQSKLHKKPVSEVNRSHQSRCLKQLLLLVSLKGIGSDTTNVMFGEHHSVVCLLKDRIPNLFVMKCLSYSAHICASQACKMLSRAIENLVRDIYSYSPIEC